LNKVVLVGFVADWCGACRAQDPILEELRKDIGNEIEIFKIDIDDNRNIFKELRIEATPTLFILKNDNIFKKFVGLTSRNDLIYALNEALMYT
jgi:thioredoxin 1